MTRPENDDRGYELPGAPDTDPEQDFTPWRPGDPTTAGEAPENYASADGAALGLSDLTRAPAGRQRDVVPDQPAQRTRWWTEESADRWEAGDKVRAHDAIRGTFMEHVPAGTRGRVVGRQLGALSGDWVTVEFENGYSEKVRPDELRRDSWF